jgi:hypothetical protein
MRQTEQDDAKDEHSKSCRRRELYTEDRSKRESPCYEEKYSPIIPLGYLH